MLDEFVVEDLEAKLVPCFDCVSGGFLVQRTLVATQVVRVDQLAGDGRVVRVGILANIGIFSSDVGTVDDQTVEDVMRISTKGRKQRE